MPIHQHLRNSIQVARMVAVTDDIAALPKQRSKQYRRSGVVEGSRV
jgi:hypothetical protein